MFKGVIVVATGSTLVPLGSLLQLFVRVILASRPLCLNGIKPDANRV
jgi:hypothetical protein